MLDLALNYYKSLFAREDSLSGTIGSNFWDFGDLATEEEKCDVICPLLVSLKLKRLFLVSIQRGLLV